MHLPMDLGKPPEKAKAVEGQKGVTVPLKLRHEDWDI